MDEEMVSYLIRMHQIINLPEYNNCVIVTQYLVEMIKLGISLPEANKMLREIKSRVYLIGLPLDFYKSGKVTWLTKSFPISDHLVLFREAKRHMFTAYGYA